MHCLVRVVAGGNIECIIQNLIGPKVNVCIFSADEQEQLVVVVRNNK